MRFNDILRSRMAERGRRLKGHPLLVRHKQDWAEDKGECLDTSFLKSRSRNPKVLSRYQFSSS